MVKNDGGKATHAGGGVREVGHKFEHAYVVRHVSIQMNALLFLQHGATKISLLQHLKYRIARNFRGA